MSLQKLCEWAQSQVDNTAKPEVRPDIGISVLQIIDELEKLELSPSKRDRFPKRIPRSPPLPSKQAPNP